MLNYLVERTNQVNAVINVHFSVCVCGIFLLTGKIPDEARAMQIAAPANAVSGVMPPSSSWPSNVVNQVGLVKCILIFKTHIKII